MSGGPHTSLQSSADAGRSMPWLGWPRRGDFLGHDRASDDVDDRRGRGGQGTWHWRSQCPDL